MVALDLNKITEVIRPLIEKSGYSLYDVEFQGRTLRVFIDKEGGTIGVDDCAETSRLLNPVLDVEDLVPGGAYELEVSSPGLDRDLKRPEHFKNVVGKMIHVQTSEPVAQWNNGFLEYFEKRKKFKGELKNVNENQIELSGEQGGPDMVVIPWGVIARSYLDFELTKQPPKGQKGAKKRG